MKILLVGAKGNMGRRYSAVLKDLGRVFTGIDVGQFANVKDYDAIILATPTDTHSPLLREFAAVGTQAWILCEKPIVKSERDLGLLGELPLSLCMVNQYAYLNGLYRVSDKDETSWNYWNSGKDGLYWDCIQVINLAKGPVTLKDDSPVWTCVINGWSQSIAHMDFAYIDMMKDFLGPKEKCWGKKDIEAAHLKVLKLAALNSSPL